MEGFSATAAIVKYLLQIGKLHAISILPKYQNATGGHSKVVPDDTDFYRSFDSCASKNLQYVAAGEEKKPMPRRSTKKCQALKLRQ